MMEKFWQQSTLTQDQFDRIDAWKYASLKQTRQLNPLQVDFKYCVVARKIGLIREAFFSPGSLSHLRQANPDFKLFQATPIPEFSVVTREANHNLVFWFGDIQYFFENFPTVD